ncbi:MAG: hypothetical protein KKB20_18925 [Proteobacteria bacterium]|nr:hypothetical protein [Pseudomonadota bacterium]
MNEALKMEGRLARLKREAGGLELRIRTDVTAVRDLLDPFADDPADLRAEDAAALAVELAGRVVRLRETRARLRAVARALGR